MWQTALLTGFLMVASSVVAISDDEIRALQFPLDRPAQDPNPAPRSLGESQDAPEVPDHPSFTYVVSIEEKDLPPHDAHFCGGTLIDKQWVLTAAHCFFRTDANGQPVQISKDQIIVKTGVALIEEEERQDSSFIEVDSVYIHEGYAQTVYSSVLNDIALIKLKTPAMQNIRIKKFAKLNEESELADRAHVYGWGKPSWTARYIHAWLRYLLLRKVSASDCNNANNYNGIVDENMICMLGDQGTDACGGDSGGPLIGWYRNDTRKQVVIGIVSWGDQCGETKRPGIYVRVSKFVAWIEKTKSSN